MSLASMIKIALYVFTWLCLAIYSYGFLDFNLTLSSSPTFLNFVSPLQQLVYFDRPLSSKIFSTLMIFLFVGYLAALRYHAKYNLSKFPWRFVIIVLLIATFSYPMLSYDVFNYMFHGKILWLYQMNPHVHAPLEFSGDLWLRFMRWVHTPSAYGPVFTAIESPAYLLGLGKFVPVLYLMKITMTLFFVWCIHLIGDIAHEIGFKKDKIITTQLLIALNPFLIMDTVVNGHNDAVMMALFLVALYYSIKSRVGTSLLALIASIGTKFMTILTLPLYFIKSPRNKILFSFLVLLIPVIVSLGRFQPWYLVWAIIPAVLTGYQVVKNWVILASLAGAIFYYPYVATGFWVNSLPFVAAIVYLPILISLIYAKRHTLVYNG